MGLEMNTEEVKKILTKLIELKCFCSCSDRLNYTLIYREYEIKISNHSIFINNTWVSSGDEDIYYMVKKYYDKELEKKGIGNILRNLNVSITKDLRNQKLKKLPND